MNTLLSRRGIVRLLLTTAALIMVVGCGNDGNTPPNSENVPKPVPQDGSAGAYKLQVAETGIYRIAPSEVGRSGFDVNSINLTQAGVQIPFTVDGGNLVFYGQESDSRYNTNQPYVLTPGEAGVQMSVGAVPEVANPALTSVPQELFLEQNLYYEQRAAEADGEVYFWKKILSSGEDAIFETTFDLPSVGENNELMMHFYGLTYDAQTEPDHDFEVLINGQSLGQITFDGDTYFLSNTPVDKSILKQGENTLTIDNSALGMAFIDQVFLDYIALSYDAPAMAVDDRLTIETTNGLVTTDGFSTQPLILNVTDGTNPVLVTNWSYADGKATVSASSDVQLALVGNNGYMKPAAIEPLATTTLKDTSNQADMLIVTTRELASALDPLVKAREAQGIKSHIAFIDDIYDEFAYGDTTPYAVQTFATYAVNNWQQPAPRYLFLVGEATTDTLGYEANRPEQPITPPNNIVPSPIIKVNFSGETVSDARLGDVDGDFKPDLAVGRWPVDSVDEVRSLVDRTLSYETNPANANAVFSSDPSSEVEFSGFTNRLIERTAFPIEHAELFNSPDNSSMLAAWEDAWLVSYVGHGSLQLWGEDELLTIDQVDDTSLGNTPPIILQFSCLTGQFAHPSVQTISEKMLSQDKGPVLIVAATSLTLSGNQSPFAINLMNGLRSTEYERIGDALQAAKKELDVQNRGLREISDTFGLLGDPSALISRPDTVLQTPEQQQQQP